MDEFYLKFKSERRSQHMNLLNVFFYHGTPPKIPTLAKKHGDGSYALFIRSQTEGYSCKIFVFVNGKKQAEKELPDSSLTDFLVTINRFLSGGLNVRAVVFPESSKHGLDRMLRNNQDKFNPPLNVVGQIIDH